MRHQLTDPLTQIYSEDIGISFGLERCGKMVVKRGKITKTNVVEWSTSHIASTQRRSEAAADMRRRSSRGNTMARQNPMWDVPLTNG